MKFPFCHVRGRVKVSLQRCNDVFLIQEHCHHYQEDLDELRNMTVGSEDYEELFVELDQLVCNKEEKGYCCSTIAPNGGLFIAASSCCSLVLFYPSLFFFIEF